jgi:hypothetical protein
MMGVARKEILRIEFLAQEPQKSIDFWVQKNMLYFSWNHVHMISLRSHQCFMYWLASYLASSCILITRPAQAFSTEPTEPVERSSKERNFHRRKDILILSILSQALSGMP